MPLLGLPVLELCAWRAGVCVSVHREPPLRLLLGGGLSRGLGMAQLRGSRPGGVRWGGRGLPPRLRHTSVCMAIRAGLGPAVAGDTASCSLRAVY